MVKRILLVEDELSVADLYKMQLEKEACSVDIASTGTDAITKLKSNQYDLILLDILLPDINGIELLKQIKAVDTLKAVPVILLTNLAQDNIIKEGFKTGAVGYLIKSQLVPNQLFQEIEAILASLR